MILSECIYIRKTKELMDMLSSVTEVYNKTLYLLRKSYFEQLERGEKIKLPTSKEVYDTITKEECWRNANCVDTCAKNFAMSSAVQNFYNYFKAKRSYNKNPKRFKGVPKIPNYVKDRYVPVTFDKSRLGKGRGKKHRLGNYQFGIHKSKCVISLSKRFEKSQIRNVSFNQKSGKICVLISYEVSEKEKRASASSIGLDVGVNNLAAITSNDKSFSYIVKGGPLKSINQYYNKKRAELQKKLEVCNHKKRSKRLEQLTEKRNRKVKDYMHKASRKIIDLCVENDISKLVIGHNNGWKQDVNHGRRNNQNFVSIPFNNFIQMLQYKGELEGIEVIVVEESYTSKVDHLVFEEMVHHEKYQGKRAKRGLFKSSCGKTLNADVNGAIGMLRKAEAIPDAQLLGLRDRGDVVSPRVLKIQPLKESL